MTEDELKAAIDAVRKSGSTIEAQHNHRAEVARRFLATHGNALIAALELAEAVDVYDNEMEDDRYKPDDLYSTPEVQAAYKALDALKPKRGAWRGFRCGQHTRITDGHGNWWGHEADARGEWYTFVASGRWTEEHCPELHGPELDALVAEFEAWQKTPSNPPRPM